MAIHRTIASAVSSVGRGRGMHSCEVGPRAERGAMASIIANDTTLYYERRGDGHALLFISGATGDAGHWTGVADTLANEYTVITYDRRGNSRSPRPSGWTSTTVDEQADDAAALLRGLDLAPAIVFGTSAGASIAANLAIRHPAVLRGVIFHEPVFRSGVASAANSRERRKALFEEGMARGGIRAATEHFLISVAGQDTYESLDPELRERLLLNGDVLINIELTPLPEYEPTPAELASMRLPRLVTAGGDNRDTTAPGHWRYEVATHLASQLDTPFAELPGAHMAYLSQPTAFAQALRPLLNKLI
jgi:pimeloyl-ACP methyl ester carboxylesterase